MFVAGGEKLKGEGRSKELALRGQRGSKNIKHSDSEYIKVGLT